TRRSSDLASDCLPLTASHVLRNPASPPLCAIWIQKTKFEIHNPVPNLFADYQPGTGIRAEDRTNFTSALIGIPPIGPTLWHECLLLVSPVLCLSSCLVPIAASEHRTVSGERRGQVPLAP